MPLLTELLAEYGESHTHATNKKIHFLCVPAIFWSICGLLHSIKLNVLPAPFFDGLDLPVMLAVLFYYFRLSARLSVGFVAWGLTCMAICSVIEDSQKSLPIISLCVFGVAWAGQFAGHHIEGKKPSFFKDLQFLLIGPAWIMQFIYKNLGIKL